MIFRFIRHVLTRFAKTFGCFFLIAGLGVAGWFYQQKTPMIDSVRYRQSNLLAERLGNLESIYGDSQRMVIKFKGATDFPSEYAAAAFKPQFPQRYSSVKNFQDLQAQLSQVSGGKDAMKRFVTDHFETLLQEIQQKLIAHAASLAPPPTPGSQPTPAAKLTFTTDYGLYDSRINTSEVDTRKSSLDDAKQFLGVLQNSAESDENKKRLGDSIAEIDALVKLLPTNIEPVTVVQPVPYNPAPREPLNAEKVATRIAEIRKSVRQAIVSSWALDEADDRALKTAEEEQSKFLASEYRVRALTEELHLAMAMAITAGVVLGVFFLLIGDWTQKSSTELLTNPWCVLIQDCSASTQEVYEMVEKTIAARKIPDLEMSRVFWHEGGALSAKREYLQFSRERLVFEICAAPFGTGFFISFRTSMMPLIVDPLAIFLVLAVTGGALLALAQTFGLMWGGVILVFSFCVLVFLMRTALARGLANVDRVLMKTPLIAPLYEFFLRPLTYYRIDTTAMYLQAVQGVVSEVFQQIFGEQGAELLPNLIPPNVMEELYRLRIR